MKLRDISNFVKVTQLTGGGVRMEPSIHHCATGGLHIHPSARL